MMSRRKKLAILGGSFDPPHIGHAEIATAALEAHPELTDVLFIPAGLPALKRIRHMSPTVYRYQMTTDLVKELDCCRVSDFEVSRPGPSYTLNTVRHFLKKVKGPEDLYFIVGYDVLFDLPNWHEPESLLQSCTLLAGTRPGYSRAAVKRQIKLLENRYKARIELFEMPLQAASSTEIRALFQAGVSRLQKPRPEDFLTEAVSSFCRRYELYEKELYPEAVSDSVLEQFFLFQQKMWSSMSFSRLLHSVSTGMLAMNLAVRFETDPGKALIAGLLHDLAKEKDGPSWLAQHPEERAWLAGYRPVVHGAYGADLARRDWGLEDEDVLAAIRYHTTLRAGASNLEKIIFLADKIECGRRYGDLQNIRRSAKKNLDEAVFLCLKAIIDVMYRRKERPHPYTLAALKELEGSAGKGA